VVKVLKILKVFTKEIISFEMVSKKEKTYHFIFFPCPLKINTAIFTTLNDRPATSTCLHVTVGLQGEGHNY
jgi:hypothetical protein